MIDVLQMMMAPAALLLRFAMIVGSFWLVPMAWRLLRDEARDARHQAMIEHARYLHPAGGTPGEGWSWDETDLPYDFDLENEIEPEADLLAVYDEVVLGGYRPDADETFEEVADRLDVPVEHVRALLGRSWLE